MISSLFLCRKLHLFLGKSTKTAATRAALFDSNMHQSFVGWGFASDPTGSLQHSLSDHLAVFREPTSKGRGRGGERLLNNMLQMISTSKNQEFNNLIIINNQANKMQLTLGNPAEVEDECFVFDLIMDCVNAVNTKHNCLIN